MSIICKTNIRQLQKTERRQEAGWGTSDSRNKTVMTLFCFLLASCIPDLRVEAVSLDTPMVEDQKKKKRKKKKDKGKKQQNGALTKCPGNEQSSKITDHI